MAKRVSKEVQAARETRAAWLNVEAAKAALRAARSRLNRAMVAQVQASGRER